MSELTWRDVFDCKKQYGHIGKIAVSAKDSGYDYFIWNGRVYELDKFGDNSFATTELTADDLK